MPSHNLLQEIFTAALSSLAILSVLGFQCIYLLLIMWSTFDILWRQVCGSKVRALRLTLRIQRLLSKTCEEKRAGIPPAHRIEIFRTSSHHFSRLAPERSFRFFWKIFRNNADIEVQATRYYLTMYFRTQAIFPPKWTQAISLSRSRIGFTQRKDCIRHKKSHKTFTQNLCETSGFLYKKTVRWVTRSQGRNVKVVPKGNQRRLARTTSLRKPFADSVNYCSGNIIVSTICTKGKELNNDL